MELQNTSSERRVWSSLQTMRGRTLGLDPGEVADVAVDEAPDDPWLKPAKGAKAAGGRNPRGRGGKAASGQQDVPGGTSDVDPTSGSGDPSPDPGNDEPAADADGKEA